MSQIFNILCRGLVGHYSYMATTSSNTVYSEYLLYEPMLRIFQAKGYHTHCEFTIENSGKGDNKRIDFRVKKDLIEFAIEVKWARSKTINVDNDIDKLIMYNNKYKSNGYILVFGYFSDIQNLKFSNNKKYISSGKIVHWDSGKTNYAARWFKIV